MESIPQLSVPWRRESHNGQLRVDKVLVEINLVFHLAKERGGDSTLALGELSGDSLARFHAERWTHITSVKRVRR